MIKKNIFINLTDAGTAPAETWRVMIYFFDLIFFFLRYRTLIVKDAKQWSQEMTCKCM